MPYIPYRHYIVHIKTVFGHNIIRIYFNRRNNLDDINFCISDFSQQVMKLIYIYKDGWKGIVNRNAAQKTV